MLSRKVNESVNLANLSVRISRLSSSTRRSVRVAPDAVNYRQGLIVDDTALALVGDVRRNVMTEAPTPNGVNGVLRGT